MRASGLWILFFAVLFSACDSGQNQSQDEMKNRLVGTWLSEFESDELRYRLVVTLSKEGAFSEVVHIALSDGDSQGEKNSGDWYFDGTNFKRRYRLVNGIPPSRSFVFSNYEVRSLSETELIGFDNLQKREVRFRRVAPGTEP